MTFRLKSIFLFLLAYFSFSCLALGQIDIYPFSKVEKTHFHKSLKENSHLHLFSTIDQAAEDSSTKLFSIAPILDLSGGLNSENKTAYNITGGVTSRLTIKDKWRFELDYAFINESTPRYIQHIQDSLNIMLGIGYSSEKGQSLSGHYYTGKVNYQISKNFDLELGRGKTFWGNGYRSLILSDNASPYPYLKINTNVWNIRYVNMWAQMQDRIDHQLERKYMAFHALSWNIIPRLNLTFYESVIWQAKDTNNTRNLDINYFNPVIFYRPVEYALGSADNVLVGASLSFQWSKKTRIYSQFLLDEFLFKEVKARSGWWANKYGLQIGLKTYDLLQKGIDLQTELNFARPFTYSHGSVLQNYGNQQQSLAHPLETNFVEWVSNIRYSKEKWEVNNSFIWAIYGRDEHGQNLGGNIYNPYATVENIYGNYLAQGSKKTILSNRISIDRFINSDKTFRLGLTNLCRYEANNSEKELDIYLLLQVKFNPILRNINR